jgi:hypothetical protein
MSQFRCSCIDFENAIVGRSAATINSQSFGSGHRGATIKRRNNLIESATVSDKSPANPIEKPMSFWESMLRRIRTLFGFRMQPAKTMEELVTDSPELAKYISELENKVS